MEVWAGTSCLGQVQPCFLRKDNFLPTFILSYQCLKIQAQNLRLHFSNNIFCLCTVLVQTNYRHLVHTATIHINVYILISLNSSSYVCIGVNIDVYGVYLQTRDKLVYHISYLSLQRACLLRNTAYNCCNGCQLSSTVYG